jgi:hypothetical protein
VTGPAGVAALQLFGKKLECAGFFAGHSPELASLSRAIKQGMIR